MTRRVLIVVPQFAPSNAADSHRVRLLLPFIEENEWDAEVLAIDPKFVAAPQDAWLEEGLPRGVAIHRVNAPGLIGGMGLWPRALDFRARGPLRKKGSELLKTRAFDLVFFSSTVFGVHSLACSWRKSFGVPYVMDYQDPWVTNYYYDQKIKPPGGWLKYRISQAIGRVQEKAVLKDCGGVVAVSGDYLTDLETKYSGIKVIPKLVLPFPGSTFDLARAREELSAPSSSTTGFINWVYVGVCGPLMERSLVALLTAVKGLLSRKPSLRAKLRLHFIGTSYAKPGTGVPSVLPHAAKLGVEEVVIERTDRVAYSTALQLMCAADALILPGTSDPTYTASKLYQCLLVGKPLLAIFRQESSVCSVMKEVEGGTCVPFAVNESSEEIARRIEGVFLSQSPFIPTVLLNKDRFEPYTDKYSARKLCRFFNEVCDR